MLTNRRYILLISPIMISRLEGIGVLNSNIVWFYNRKNHIMTVYWKDKINQDRLFIEFLLDLNRYNIGYKFIKVN